MVPRIGLVVCGALLFSFATSSVAAYAYKCEPAVGLQNFPWEGSSSALPSSGSSVEIPVPGVAEGQKHYVLPGPMPPENNQAAGYLGSSSGQGTGAWRGIVPSEPSVAQRLERALPGDGYPTRAAGTRAVGYAPMIAPGAQDPPARGRR